jgi:hypothetical protein
MRIALNLGAPIKFRLRSGLQSTGPLRLGFLESILSSIEPAGQSEVRVDGKGRDCADIDGITLTTLLCIFYVLAD